MKKYYHNPFYLILELISRFVPINQDELLNAKNSQQQEWESIDALGGQLTPEQEKEAAYYTAMIKLKKHCGKWYAVVISSILFLIIEVWIFNLRKDAMSEDSLDLDKLDEDALMKKAYEHLRKN